MMLSASREARDRKVIAEQASILLTHITDDTLDYEFLRVHTLMIYQCVAGETLEEQMLASEGSTLASLARR